MSDQSIARTGARTGARTRTIRGVEVPTFFYGTAWKEDDTADLVKLALREGFRAIDTANQRKHYFEAAVGDAIAHATDSRAPDDDTESAGDGPSLSRDDLFLQTKFTYRAGQDHRLPYDVNADTATQVRQSFASSLEHLKLDPEAGVIDSYVLHGPSSPRAWTDTDRDAWAAMESLADDRRVRLLGVSNVGPHHLEAVCAEADISPAFVQNRCFADTGWDAEVRAICRDQDIVYQGFSLLTANVRHLRTPAFQQVVERSGMTPAQVVFRAALQMGMIPLTGTTDRDHMREDLAVYGLELDDAALETVRTIARR